MSAFTKGDLQNSLWLRVLFCPLLFCCLWCSMTMALLNTTIKLFISSEPPILIVFRRLFFKKKKNIHRIFKKEKTFTVLSM